MIMRYTNLLFTYLLTYSHLKKFGQIDTSYPVYDLHSCCLRFDLARYGYTVKLLVADSQLGLHELHPLCEVCSVWKVATRVQ